VDKITQYDMNIINIDRYVYTYDGTI